MRLINTATIKLIEYMDHEIPVYAILSHTWGTDEVTFQDMQKLEIEERKTHSPSIQISQITSKKGYSKIKQSCQRALQNKIYHVWVDTCCIDKTSSAELSEAINSMMRWYEKAHVCYAYLADVPPNLDPNQPAFQQSRWFTRGWTLQELLAPQKLLFLAQDWSDLFYRETVCGQLSEITSISVSFLEQRQHFEPDLTLRSRLNSVSIAERMSWASKRETSRQEDRAYSLLGIFGINMPLLYGEGAGAFLRLQEEIIKHSDDQSLLAWHWDPIKNIDIALKEFQDLPQLVKELKMSTSGTLASSPAAFRKCGDYIPCSFGTPSSPFSITNKGLSMDIPLLIGDDVSFALLQCQTKKDPTVLIAVPIKCIQGNLYVRAKGEMHLAGHQAWLNWPRKQVYLLPSLDFMSNAVDIPDFTVIMETIPSNLHITKVHSPCLPKPDPMILMKGEFSENFLEWGARVLVWFEDTNENSRFVFVFHLSSTSLGRTRETRQIDDFWKNSMFLFIGKNIDPTPEDLMNWSRREIMKAAPKNNRVPYSAAVVTEDFFGKFLFKVEIKAGSSYEKDPKDLKGLNDTSWLRDILMPGVHERQLRARWLNALRSYYTPAMRYIRRLIIHLRLLPWMLTFIIELPFQRFFALLFRIATDVQLAACLFASLSAGGSLLSGIPLRRLVLSWIPGFLHKDLRGAIFGLSILYFYCKLLPDNLLSIMLRVQSSEYSERGT
ncbi:hypothetical protein N7490_011811 [Penicillium lividum]|nr:hypothetical protein N7490_011811 [Penicillium lividum]